jgi:hypothetical protein
MCCAYLINKYNELENIVAEAQLLGLAQKPVSLEATGGTVL